MSEAIGNFRSDQEAPHHFIPTKLPCELLKIKIHFWYYLLRHRPLNAFAATRSEEGVQVEEGMNGEREEGKVRAMNSGLDF